MKEPLLPLNYPAGKYINMEMNSSDNTAPQFVVIDDDTINNMVCKAAIKSATGGMQAVCFNNPAEALNYVAEFYTGPKNKQPTILFLDLNMPEMNGWEWLEKYANMTERVKNNVTVYILSSSVNPTDINLAHSNRLVKDYIIKPLTKTKIIELLHGYRGPVIDLKAV
jgi:CheY-like chemotaxis protein